MKMYEINRWKDSATESWSQNKESVKKNGVECYFDEEFVVNPNVDTVEGLMDVYYKKGSDLSVGAKKYLNGDFSNNGTEVELYTIGSDWKPKFFIRISSKDGSEITDDIIKSHIEIFYSQKEAI